MTWTQFVIDRGIDVLSSHPQAATILIFCLVTGLTIAVARALGIHRRPNEYRVMLSVFVSLYILVLLLKN